MLMGNWEEIMPCRICDKESNDLTYVSLFPGTSMLFTTMKMCKSCFNRLLPKLKPNPIEYGLGIASPSFALYCIDDNIFPTVETYMLFCAIMTNGYGDMLSLRQDIRSCLTLQDAARCLKMNITRDWTVARTAVRKFDRYLQDFVAMTISLTEAVDWKYIAEFFLTGENTYKDNQLRITLIDNCYKKFDSYSKGHSRSKIEEYIIIASTSDNYLESRLGYYLRPYCINEGYDDLKDYIKDRIIFDEVWEFEDADSAILKLSQFREWVRSTNDTELYRTHSTYNFQIVVDVCYSGKYLSGSSYKNDGRLMYRRERSD
jgi:hypothetical protein